MIPVLMAVSPAVWITGVSALWWTAGLLLGLRVNAKRLASLREQLRLANQLHSAYITSAHNEDLAEVGPATGDQRTVELFDQDAASPQVNQVEHPADIYSFIGLHSELPRPPIPMTGERDTEAQDTELAETFDICPGCSGSLMVLDDGSRWCPQCHSFWDQVEPDGPEAVSAQVNQVEPAVGRAVMRGLSVYDEETGEQLAGPEIDCPEEGGCRRPEQCETGCHWLRLRELNRPLIEDEDSGPRSIPGLID